MNLLDEIKLARSIVERNPGTERTNPFERGTWGEEIWNDGYLAASRNIMPLCDALEKAIVVMKQVSASSGFCEDSLHYECGEKSSALLKEWGE